jgi:hypothetical protein
VKNVTGTLSVEERQKIDSKVVETNWYKADLVAYEKAVVALTAKTNDGPNKGVSLSVLLTGVMAISLLVVTTL